MLYTVTKWGPLSCGRTAHLITLESPAGAAVEIGTFGGVIRALTLPLPCGKRRQVVLGFPALSDYEADTANIGCTVGPYANRIRGGAFSMGNEVYQLERNENGNTLHSGGANFGKTLFDHSRDGDGLLLTCRHLHGRGGFPGNLDVAVRFSWREPMELEIWYEIETDRDTVASPTNHSYFNLGTEQTVLSHRLRIHADAYTPVDGALLPTGTVAPVGDTAFDFREMRPIGQHYDQNVCLTPGDGPAATLEAPDRALRMDVYTDLPGLQLYTGTHLPAPFPPYGGVCLETQHFPDAPNIPGFPSSRITPQSPLRSYTRFAFSTEGV